MDLETQYSNCITQVFDNDFFHQLAIYCKDLFSQDGFEAFYNITVAEGREKYASNIWQDIEKLESTLSSKIIKRFPRDFSFDDIRTTIPHPVDVLDYVATISEATSQENTSHIYDMLRDLKIKLQHLQQVIRIEPWYCLERLYGFYYSYFAISDLYSFAGAGKSKDISNLVSTLDIGVIKVLNTRKQEEAESFIFSRQEYQQFLVILHTYLQQARINGVPILKKKQIVRYAFDTCILAIADRDFKFGKNDIITAVLEFILKHSDSRFEFGVIEREVERTRGGQLNDRSIEVAVRNIIDKVRCDFLIQINGTVFVNSDNYELRL